MDICISYYMYSFNKVITMFSGLMSGLTVGYLSIDDLLLDLKAKTGTEQDKLDAEKLLPILEKRHWLLVTLLLSNAVAMETLPICLHKIVPEVVAILFSVVLVLIFGEIVPQAYCTGASQIAIASFVAPLTKALY